MTGAWLALAVAVAGGAGAACRMLLDGVITARTRLPYPVGTTVINLTGALLLGLVTGIAGHALPGAWALVVGTGLLGGYTTFSTASLETVRLAQDARWRAAALNAFGLLIGALAAAALGLWLGGML
ncbi:hypothetical protein GCM10022240_05060 [Microbacterium kribbense]|uniref:Fluoride-specific ion channel FluC n=1 Tax=Microbacterium kribbense TaxID=433645 RepID=A0ABP7G7L8_9MICO